MSEFSEIDAAVNARDRRLVIAAVLGWLVLAMDKRDVGWLARFGWVLAMRYAANIRSQLLQAAEEAPRKVTG